MYYNARWYDSSVGRFAQADTVVPDGVQGYDRYVYANNSPVKNTDPTGHWPCDSLGSCFSLATSAATSALNSPLANYAAYEIAQKYFPATAKGSQAQVSASGSLLYGIVGEKNVITSADGKLMTFDSSGGGLGTAQAGIAVSTGPIFGDGFDSPQDFAGPALQGSVSVGLVAGPAADAWTSMSIVSNNGKAQTILGQVWGYDIGISIGASGPLPGSVQASVVNAIPLMEEEKQLNGVELLACRMLYQCGRDPDSNSGY